MTTDTLTVNTTGPLHVNDLASSESPYFWVIGNPNDTVQWTETPPPAPPGSEEAFIDLDHRVRKLEDRHDTMTEDLEALDEGQDDLFKLSNAHLEEINSLKNRVMSLESMADRMNDDIIFLLEKLCDTLPKGDLKETDRLGALLANANRRHGL